MELWRRTGPTGADEQPAVRRTATVGRDFEVHWTVSGTPKPHWIEITCPSGGKFKSHEFDAGKLGVKVSLGKVVLTPPSSPSSAPAKASR